MNPIIIHSQAFVEDAANVIIETARETIQERGVFRLCLCGGNTPKPVFAKLAESSEIDWSKVLITFGDERCVPPGDAQSNYKMAKESLLDPAKVPQENVFRIRGELPPEEAARDYQEQIALLASRFGEDRFAHDLLLLGLGEDGHTASLFPGTDALQEQTRDVVANFVPKFNASRITFTYPLINAARQICFLVNDPGKAGVVQEVLEGKNSHPAARVVPKSGHLAWVLGF
jgi:6-phosphogluconolactonase